MIKKFMRKNRLKIVATSVVTAAMVLLIGVAMIALNDSTGCLLLGMSLMWLGAFAYANTVHKK